MGNWWDDDKAADWWSADKAVKPAASSNLDVGGVRGGGILPAIAKTAENEAMIVGAGRMGDVIWEGIKQGGLGTGAILAQALPDRLRNAVMKEITKRWDAQASQQAEKERLYRPLSDEMPISTGIGEAAVQMAFPMGRATQGAGVVKTAMSGAPNAALPGVLEYGSAGDRATRGALGAAGQAVGGTVLGGLGRLAKPVDALPSPAVKEALALGYELPAGVRTGSSKLQALEAALEQLPGGGNNLARLSEANRAKTQAIADGVMEAAGGQITREEAQAAAMRSYNEGVKRVMGESSQQYDELLRGRTVETDAMRPEMEAIVSGQKALPPTERAARAVDSANAMIGTPGFKLKPGRQLSRSIDPDSDDLVTAVRKAGGLDYVEFGTLADQITFPRSLYGPVYRGTDRYGRPQGVSRDRMAERMHSAGYIDEPDPDLLVDALERASRGETVESAFKTHTSKSPIDELLDIEKAKLAAKQPQESPGWIRSNPEVPGEVAQRLRSQYSGKSETAFSKGDPESGRAFQSMRDAVDKAIDASLAKADDLPSFQAVRERYGLAKAVESLKPENQAAFLAKLYNGSRNPDQFYSWLGIAADDAAGEVRRGFLSEILQKATNAKTGEVSATKLAQVLKNTDSASRKALGGAEDAMLERVAKAAPAAEFAFPNSGTAPREFYSRLLTNPAAVYGLGGLAGAGAGGAVGGTEGAMLGVGASALLPRAASSAYYSKAMQRYLADNRMPISQEQRALMQKFGGLAGLGLASGIE